MSGWQEDTSSPAAAVTVVAGAAAASAAAAAAAAATTTKENGVQSDDYRVHQSVQSDAGMKMFGELEGSIDTKVKKEFVYNELLPDDSVDQNTEFIHWNNFSMKTESIDTDPTLTCTSNQLLPLDDMPHKLENIEDTLSNVCNGRSNIVKKYVDKRKTLKKKISLDDAFKMCISEISNDSNEDIYEQLNLDLKKNISPPNKYLSNIHTTNRNHLRKKFLFSRNSNNRKSQSSIESDHSYFNPIHVPWKIFSTNKVENSNINVPRQTPKSRQEITVGIPNIFLDQSSEVERYKKTLEPFLQKSICLSLPSIVNKCIECRAYEKKTNLTRRDYENIACRFYSFRLLKFRQDGTLTASSFLDPFKDIQSMDKDLWLPTKSSSIPSEFNIKASRKILEDVGGQFCKFIQEEKKTSEFNCLNVDIPRKIAWKKYVNGVREMCDVCKTTIFNYHWCCGNCGFMVCADCYKNKYNIREVKMGKKIIVNSAKPLKDKKWLPCSNEKDHEIDLLSITQILAGDALNFISKFMHKTCNDHKIHLDCNCGKNVIFYKGPNMGQQILGDLNMFLSSSYENEIPKYENKAHKPKKKSKIKKYIKKQSKVNKKNQVKEYINNQADEYKNNQVSESTNNQADEYKKYRAEVSIKIEADENKNNQPGECTNNLAEEYINNQAEESINNQVDESTNNQADEYKKYLAEVSIKIEPGECTNNLAEEYINNQADEYKTNEDGECTNNQANGNKNNQAQKFIKIEANENENNQPGKCTNNLAEEYINNQAEESINNQVDESTNNQADEYKKYLAEVSIKIEPGECTNNLAEEYINNQADEYKTNEAGECTNNQANGNKNNQAQKFIKIEANENENNQPGECTNNLAEEYINNPADEYKTNEAGECTNNQANGNKNNQAEESIKIEANENENNQPGECTNNLAEEYRNNHADKYQNNEASECTNNQADGNDDSDCSEEYYEDNFYEIFKDFQPGTCAYYQAGGKKKLTPLGALLAGYYYHQKTFGRCRPTYFEELIREVWLDMANGCKPPPYFEEVMKRWIDKLTKKKINSVKPEKTLRLDEIMFILKEKQVSTNTQQLSVFISNPSPTYLWLCEGHLLYLLDPNNQNNYRLFQDHWKHGQPVMVRGVGDRLNRTLWHPRSFSRDFGHHTNDLIDCSSGKVVAELPMSRFWDGFENAELRLRDSYGDPMLLKLKDWPPSADFAETLPDRFRDLMACLPLPEYTHRTGMLNLASRLPECFLPPDLGPKMYTAYGTAGGRGGDAGLGSLGCCGCGAYCKCGCGCGDGRRRYRRRRHSDSDSDSDDDDACYCYSSDELVGTTNLHLDVSDAVNVMVYVAVTRNGPDGRDQEWHKKRALCAIREAGCDDATAERLRTQGETPGALWHIYHASDADAIRDLLIKVSCERGIVMDENSDPIHDQSHYLNGYLRDRLYHEYDVKGYAIVQCFGDAVFIPAGAPHQVKNLHNCIKVAEDFVSPENLRHSFRMTEEFRTLTDSHTNHEDKLQIKNILFHAVKDSLSVLTYDKKDDNLFQL